jgi:hydrogenase 3 maturation protease
MGRDSNTDQKSDLRDQLEQLQGRVCFMGVGNRDYGDDAFGVHLAEALLNAGVGDVIVAENSPDCWLGIATDMGFDHLVFLDAVEFGAEPGSAVFLDSREIVTRYPQISTHKISLGVLASFIESNGITKVWLLGVQPASLKQGHDLSPAVRKTLGALLELLFGLRTREVNVC